MKINKKLISLLASGAMMMSTITPGLASAQGTITGNGAFSASTVVGTTSTTASLTQNNNASVSNTVSTNSNTGGNSADNATGGNVSILTGDASSNVQLATEANMNQATMMGAAQPMGTSAVVSGNGATSDNQLFGTNSNSASLTQTNDASMNNSVTTNATTGYNTADNATSGNVAIRTGSAGSSVGIFNAANSNMADMGMMGGGTMGSAFAGIGDNGAFSTNTTSLNNSNSTTATQNNLANITNAVTGNYNTGYNSANNGTGGGASIGTGNAYTFTDLQNKVNSNTANLGSMGPMAWGSDLNKIVGNGAYSDNQLFGTNTNANTASQNNDSYLNNAVANTMTTGYNLANNATGGFYYLSDPSIRTGGAYQQSTVQNQTNANTFGSFDMGGMQVTMSFDPLGIFGN